MTSKAGPVASGFFFSPLLVVACLLSSCQPTVQPMEPEPEPKKSSQTDGPTRSYLGLSKSVAIAKARKMGLRTRVVRDDFDRFPITKDLRQNRINFEIDDGLVTSAKIF